MATKHRDGTVSYWSVYNQQQRNRARSVSYRELAAMGAKERRSVDRHMKRHNWDCSDRRRSCQLSYDD